MRKKWKLKKIGVLAWLSLLTLVFMFIVNKYMKTKGSIGLHDAMASKLINKIDIATFLKAEEENHVADDLSKCGDDKTTVVITVPSAPSHFSARAAIRTSWGSIKHLPSSWVLVFYIGIAQDPTVQKEVQKEAAIHDDIAFGHFIESYKNLTLKTISLLHWVKTTCQAPRYLLKIDDDNYLNVKKFSTLIDCLGFAENNLYQKNGIVSAFATNADSVNYKQPLETYHFDGIDPETLDKCDIIKPYNLISYYISSDQEYESYIAGGYVYKHVSPDRNPTSKWYLPSEIYSASNLPNFLSGTCYLLSTNLLPHLLKEARKRPPIHLEDVYLTGILGSEALKLRLSHIDEWSNFRPRWDSACAYHELFNAHGLTASEIIDMHSAVNQLNYEKDCQGLTKMFTYFNQGLSHFFPRYKF